MTRRATTAASIWIDRAVAAVSIATVAWLLGPGIGMVNAVLGPAAGTTRSLSWPEQSAEAPQDALVRCMTAIGLVLAVRLLAGLLLALAAGVPGMTGVRAARLSIYLTPPLARRFTHVIISVGLSSWTGAALSAPAFASTQPAAVVVPTPVLAPPEATLQTWPDLGRPGTDVPTSPAPPSPAPPSTSPARHQSTHPPSGQPPASRPIDPAPATPQPSVGQAASSATMPADKQAPTTAVVVNAGDCLWTLVKHDLEGRGRTEPPASDIAAATEKWWQANRATIGANPDLLLPGERLVPPA